MGPKFTIPDLTPPAPRASRAALFVLVAFVVATPWPYGAAHPLAVRALSLVALATALLCFLARLYSGRSSAPPLEVWPLAGLFALALAQITPLPRFLLAFAAPGPAALWYPEPAAAAAVLGDGAHPLSVDPEATRRVLAFTSGVLALALLSVSALRVRRTAQTAAIVVTGGALVVALYGVVARTLFGSLLFGSIPVPTIAPFGSFVSKNHFAGYVEMATLLAAGLAWGLADEARRSSAALSWVGSARAGRVVVAAGVTLALGLAALLSMSRGGAVSLAAGALVLVGLRAFVRRKTAPSRRLLGMGLVLVALATAAAFALPEDARARLATLAGMGHDNSGQFRLGAWSDTLRLVARSPILGHGFGAYAEALPPVKTGRGYVTVEHAESDVLELLAEGGLVGLLLAAAATALLARAVARGLARQTDRLRRGLGLGAAAGAAALLVHSAIDFNLRIPSNALLFAFLCALAIAAAANPEGKPWGQVWNCEFTIPDLTPSARVAGGALAVAVSLALAVVTPAAATMPLPDEALAFAVKGGRPVTALRLTQATLAVTAHLQKRPADAPAWLFLAWLRSAQGHQGDAKTLAAYAARLDPQRAAIQTEAARIQAAPLPTAPR